MSLPPLEDQAKTQPFVECYTGAPGSLAKKLKAGDYISGMQLWVTLSHDYAEAREITLRNSRKNDTSEPKIWKIKINSQHVRTQLATKRIVKHARRPGEMHDRYTIDEEMLCLLIKAGSATIEEE